MDDMELNKVYEFPCNRWFARDEDDGAISRDLTVDGADNAPPGQFLFFILYFKIRFSFERD